MYYKRYETQWRVNLFFCASILSGSFSGVSAVQKHGGRTSILTVLQLLAYAISNMAGIGGYDGWRWIFIIEGLFTVVVASLSWIIIPDWPEKARFLNDDERRMLLLRLEEDRGAANMDRMDKSSTKRVFKDYKIYLAYV